MIAKEKVREHVTSTVYAELMQRLHTKHAENLDRAAAAGFNISALMIPPAKDARWT